MTIENGWKLQKIPYVNDVWKHPQLDIYYTVTTAKNIEDVLDEK